MKKISYLIAAFCLVSLPLLYGCSKAGNQDGMKIQPGDRVIQFAGYEWNVRSSGALRQGPGPNNFSDGKENVWVDDAGRLHLKITQKNGIWYCAEVTLRKVYGYGHYVIQVDSPLEGLDRNTVGSLFLYKNDSQEIDIEFSKWGIANNDNAQFVVQPGDKSGNKQRFQFADKQSGSVHMIDWQKAVVRFESYNGTIADTSEAGNHVASWIYQGDDNPSVQDMQVKLNLWLFKGIAPSDQKPQELIISDFKIF